MVTSQIAVLRMTCYQFDPHLKTDWGYMVEQNKHFPLDEFVETEKVVVEHVFNNRKYCVDWCDAKEALAKKKTIHPQARLSRRVPVKEKPTGN